MTWRLTREAEADIIGLYVQGVRHFGLAQADAYHARLERAFDLLAAFPQMARQRAELVPPMRVHPCGAHVIIYGVASDGSIHIARVRHGSEDWLDSSRGDATAP